ncbi:phosphoglycerate mutase [Fusarium beomiforme]|uniref:Phosphoglycerate mutase n=1 Tax=Fusarium beomiforme TaxID=44412 RepID=A0A9P5ABA9_9HYPO|nr:phosphoglycerate mutase [Fusarium beomiforme]
MAPCVFLVRHGQTDWSKIGRYTGITEKELTETGKEEAISLGRTFMGPNKLIDPSHLVRVFVSPRVRARQTFELITQDFPETRHKAIFDERFREWDHGDYEGMTTSKIRAARAERGLDEMTKWSIWTDGCEGGESVQDVYVRVMDAIDSITEVQKDFMDGETHGNIMVVGYGTFLRCFWKAWGGLSIDSPVAIQFDTGSVVTLSYKNNDVNDRIIPIGLKTNV